MSLFRRRKPYYGWWIVASGLAINVATATANPLVFSFFLGPMSDELHVGKSELGLALTFRLAAAGVSAPVLGVLLDRYGGRWTGAACGALAGAMIILLASAHELWAVYVLFSITGLAGFGAPSGQLLTVVPVARWFVRDRARALAVVTTGMAAGTVMLVPTTQGLIEWFGWRTTSMIYGTAIVAVVVPVSVLLVRRSPEDMGLYPDGADRPVHEHHGSIDGGSDWTVRQALHTRTLWLLLSALTVGSMVLTATVVHRTDYWTSLGMPAGVVGAGTAVDPLVVVFSAFGFGVVADRVPVRFLGALGFLGLCASMVPVLLSDGQAWTIFAHSAIWGLAAGAYITLNNLVWPMYFGSRFAGSIRGVVLPATVAASAAGPPVYGALFDAGIDPRSIWLLSVSGFAIAACLVAFARPPRRPTDRPLAH